MESDIEILEEVVHVKARRINTKETSCSNSSCLNAKKLIEQEKEGLLCSQQELKSALADLYRSKEKYKRLFKQCKQENEQLKAELQKNKSKKQLESNVPTVEKSPVFNDSQNADIHSLSMSSASDKQEAITSGLNDSVFQYFPAYLTHPDNCDLPSSLFSEEHQFNLNNGQLGIDQRCFQGVYTSHAHILEAKFQESSVLSKEVREECCQLTKLSEGQIINWFHMRRPNTERRGRFNMQTLSHLRQFSRHNLFPSAAERDSLAKKANISSIQVRNWFKKQREKLKKPKNNQKPAVLWYKLLEKSYNKSVNKSREEIEELHQQTMLSREQIEKWFQNRNMLAKRLTGNESNIANMEPEGVGLPSICSSADLGENAVDQDVHSFVYKQEFQDETQVSSIVHYPHIQQNGSLSTNSSYSLVKIEPGLDGDPGEDSNRIEQKISPVFKQAVLDCFSGQTSVSK